MNKNLYMNKIGEKARIAALKLPIIDIKKRNSVLKQYSRYLKTNYKSILKSNQKDVYNARLKKKVMIVGLID